MGVVGKILGAIGNQYKFSKTGTPMRTKLSLGLTTSSASLSMVFIGNIFVKFYSDIIKLDPVIIGGIYYWISIWTAICGIIIGYFMDRVKFHPKTGKYVRVMRRSAPMIILAIGAMVLMSPSLPQWLIATLFVIALMVYYLANGIYLGAYNCYYLLAAPSKEDRIDLGVIVAFIANFVSFFATLIPNFLLVGNDSMPREVIVFFLLLVLAMNSAMYFFGLRKLEDNADLYKKGSAESQKINLKTLWKDVKSFITTKTFWTWNAHILTTQAPMTIAYTMFLFMMDHVIGATGLQSAIVDTLPMIIVLAILPVIANVVKRIGARNAIFLSMLPFIAGQLFLFASKNWIMACIAYVFIWLGSYGINTANPALQGAVIDENEMKTDIRKTGLFGSISAIVMMPFAGIWTLVFMSIIKNLGYIQGAASQTAEAQMGIRIASTLVPIGMCLVGIIPLLLFPIGKKREKELSDWNEKRRHGSDESEEGFSPNLEPALD